MAPNSLQTSTGTRLSLHKNSYYCGVPNWTREHSKVCNAMNFICGKCGKMGHLDSLCRSSGTPIHMLEAQDYGLRSLHKTITRVQRLYSTPHHTSYPEKSYHRQNATTSRLYKSPDWVPMNRVNISDQPELHSLKTLRSIRWTLKLIQGQDAM